MTEHPRITIVQDLDTDKFRLMAVSYGMTAPAGPRLFRAPPHPDISFVHDNHEQAEKDAAILQAYVSEHWPKKAESKAATRKREESRA